MSLESLKQSLRGSLVALVTPMSPDGAVDYEAFERLIEHHIAAGTDGLVIAGTTGESATLSKPEHIDLVRRAVEIVKQRVPVIAGTGSNSTAQTIALSQAIDKFAVDAYLIVTPYYNKPTQEGLYQHYMAIADTVKKPVMLYNVPGRTAVDLLPATVARLAVHGNIFAIKEATGDVSRVAEIQQGCGKDFLQFSGDDATAREYMLLGGHGVISVTTNVAPKQMQAMCAAALAGDADKAAELDAPLSSLHRDLFVESNPIPVKWAVAKQGLCDGTLRLPLTELSAVNQPAVEAALTKASALEGDA
ncbi:MAG: 4-hydroxy-tetrahydrodipicolinate synthase [Chromatiales bacterium]|jgi:4-hydroxy-tetrahydrodipicolinate synthase|nr:4-hydroxy-tetrahydrodipicolinate synthase [Chromatiales bacterium]